MKNHTYRLPPSADRRTRRARLKEVRRLLEAGDYYVPAEQIAESLLADLGWKDPDSSSCGGSDADAN